MDFKSFQQPDSILRPAPFWAINDRITPEETARQMADMIDVGLSGGFFHSRAGLATDYLGDEWFQSMQAALEVAKEKNGYLWLYDEDLWPSGNAGGQVAGMKDEYRSANLVSEFAPKGAAPLRNTEDEFKAAYLLTGRKGASVESVSLTTLEEAEKHKDSERIIFRRRYTDKTPWWSGESYANLLHPEAVQEFIRLTHEKYKEKLGDEFGKRVPGIFTDEPLIPAWFALPWWDGLPGVYSEWQGRDFWADLPYLFLEGMDARRIRLLIHRTLLRQFIEAFSKTIFEWCDRNNLELTGHFNCEDTLQSQIMNHCGGIMAHYRYQHAPGIDHLARQIDGLPPTGRIPMLLTVKQASSAARQLGKKRVLTELFGVSRHTNTFEDFKWLGDFNLVLGANFFCPHLSLYSAKGRRKRDYPPNWNYQQTYWKELNPLNDYFTRLAQALTSGEAKPDVLLLHPIEGATAAHRYALAYPGICSDAVGKSPLKSPELLPSDVPGEDFSAAHEYDRFFRMAVRATLNAGYDCDLGDEGYIEDLGSVEGKLFRIGEMTYPVVVVPPSQTWRPKTFSLLKRFVGNGGRLILLGGLPTELDCEDAEAEWKALVATYGVFTVPVSAVQLQAALDKCVPRTYQLRGADGTPDKDMYLQHRINGEQEIFFVVNSDRDAAHDYRLTILGKPGISMAVWNPLDGTRRKVQPEKVGENLRYSFSLPPAGSILIVTGPGAVENASAQEKTPGPTDGEVTPFPDIWQFERTEENVLVMDRMSFSLDDGKTWTDEDMECRVRAGLSEHFEVVDALLWQPWVAMRKGVFNGKGQEIILRYKFRSAVPRPASAFLVVEDLRKGRVYVNGKEIDVSEAGWHWDRSFGKVDITCLVQQGENIVDFRVNYDFLSEVEPAYIVGNFGVRLVSPTAGEIIDEPSGLRNGSWVEQGYPFYSGNMTYRATVQIPADQKRTFLHLNNPSGIMYTVKVNGRDVGKILWRPFEIELTPFLKAGSNEINIKVIGSRQNTFGPLHEREGESNIYCKPDMFWDESLIREEFSLFDYGLLGGAELVRVVEPGDSGRLRYR